jgi:hypothetical protein
MSSMETENKKLHYKKKIATTFTSNMLLIPFVLIRNLYVLSLMTNQYPQECLFECEKSSKNVKAVSIKESEGRE